MLEVSMTTFYAVQLAESPKTQGELRSFLSLFNVLRRLLPDFSCIAKPSNLKLEKNQPFKLKTFQEQDVRAFEDIKSAVVKPPIFALPERKIDYALVTDACDYQLGCTMRQEQRHGMKHPIGYWSRG